MNKKGMEMWQIVLLVLLILIALFLIIWFGKLGGDTSNIIKEWISLS